MSEPALARRPRLARSALFALAALALLALGALGCHTRQTRDYGAGECVEYTPVCIWGTPVCDIDKRGCRVCTCAERGSPSRLDSDPAHDPQPVDPRDGPGRP
ncbi:MAG: hypothetical protein H6744_15160 [Deltaproteobacteria bacterium]|nr:hypothetical protein [Deltaproteobacteria bacterium]MCB9788020.1 hypothetical protein [Deltaproteobacteria bacterium]